MNWLKKLFGGDSGGNGGGTEGNGADANGSDSGPDMITCHEALERLYEFLDGELVPTEQGQVEEHFRMCQRCYPNLQFERSFLQAVQRVEGNGSPPDELRARVLQALKNEGLDAG